MKKNALLLFLCFVILLQGCKKENISSKYTFEISSTVLGKTNYPFAKVFLYDEQGDIVDEQELTNNKPILLSDNKDGKHNIAVFATRFYSTGGDSYQFDYFYDVPNNSKWKYEKGIFTNFAFSEVESPRVIELSNVTSIDTFVKTGGFFNEKISYNALEKKAYISGLSNDLEQVLYLKVNKESPLRYIVLNKYKKKGATDTTKIDLKKIQIAKKEILKLPSSDSWKYILSAKNKDTLFHVYNIYTNVLKPIKESNVFFPSEKFDNYYQYLEANSPDNIIEYYIKTKDIKTSFTLPNLDTELSQNNDNITYKGNANVKVVNIEGYDFNNSFTFVWAIHAPSDGEGKAAIVWPKLPTSIAKKYTELKNYTYTDIKKVWGITFINNPNMNYYDYLRMSYDPNNKVIYKENALFEEWKYDNGFVSRAKLLK